MIVCQEGLPMIVCQEKITYDSMSGKDYP